MPGVDHYTQCPCGSGKKLKFCKCVDNMQDFEKVTRLIEGGQELAAVDRINQLLAKTPNAAWLLALKSRLMLGLHEEQGFIDTVNRFLKLKPDNPLALMLKSIASSIQHEPIENMARHLLDGLAESRDGLPEITMGALQLLLHRLSESDRPNMIGTWGEIYDILTQESNAPSVLQDPQINLICKMPNKIIDCPPNAAWRERMAEVRALSGTFRYEQAEKKLQSILRDFPGQPGPLSHLLRAQVAQLDQASAAATARKLSDLTELSVADRTYFRVLALEYEPGQKSLIAESRVHYCEIDSEERVTEVLASLDSVRADDSDEARQFMALMVGDEVPARRVYELHQSEQVELPGVGHAELRSFAGVLAVFGKQTDKPARLLFMADDYPAYRPLFEATLNALQLGAPVEGVQPDYAQSYVDFLNRNMFLADSESPWVNIELRGKLLVDQFLNHPQKVLDGQTPLEAAGDERKRLDLLALVAHLEGSQAIIVSPETFAEIYQRLGLDQPATVVIPAGEKSVAIKSLLDLLRFDYKSVDDGKLLGLVNRAAGCGAFRLQYFLAHEIVARPSLAEEPNVSLTAHAILFELEPDLNQKIDHSVKMEEILAAAGAPVGEVVVRRMSLLMQLGREQEGQECLMTAVRKYPQDPQLGAFLQRISAGRQAPMSAPQNDDLAMKMLQSAPSRTASRSGEGSGLVLPGQSSAEPQGESKLWLPGT